MWIVCRRRYIRGEREIGFHPYPRTGRLKNEGETPKHDVF